MKTTKGMDNGNRGRNNQKWQGLEEKEKMDVKTLVEAEIIRKNGRTQALLEKRGEKTH